jgi:hypothetical protein
MRIHANNGVHIDSILTVGSSIATGRRTIAENDSIKLWGTGNDNSSVYIGRSQLTFFNENNADWNSTAKGLDISPVYGTTATIQCIRYKASGGTWDSIARFSNVNTALGLGALRDLDWNMYGERNMVIGNYALTGLQTGARNVAIGADAGTYATNGGAFVRDTNNSIYIGDSACAGSTTGRTNQIVIGYGATGGGSNTVTIGSSSMNSAGLYRMYGSNTWTNASDIRLKEDIHEADLGRCAEIVKTLPVKRYKYRDFHSKNPRDTHVIGFIADDVEKIFPKSITRLTQSFPLLDENGEEQYELIDGKEIRKEFEIEDVKELTMSEGLPTLWGAVQRLIQQNEEKDILIQDLIERVETVESTKAQSITEKATKGRHKGGE